MDSVGPPKSSDVIALEAYRNWVALASEDRKPVSRESVRDLDLVRSSFILSLAWGGLVASPIAIIVVANTWSELGRSIWPAWAIWLSAIIGIFVCTLVAWGTALFLSSTYAVALNSLGLMVLTRRPFSRGLYLRVVKWEDLKSADPTGPLGHSVMVYCTGPPIWLTRSQARAVLSDSRYPLRGSLTAEVRSRVGLGQ
jgi:hypothetical protein